MSLAKDGKPKAVKPKEISLYDGHAKCVTEEPAFNEAFGVEIEGFIYDSTNLRMLINWLEKAEKWLIAKEEYR